MSKKQPHYLPHWTLFIHHFILLQLIVAYVYRDLVWLKRIFAQVHVMSKFMSIASVIPSRDLILWCPLLLLGDGEGQGDLMWCCPWGHKESDTTEQQQQQKNFYYCRNLNLEISKCRYSCWNFCSKPYIKDVQSCLGEDQISCWRKWWLQRSLFISVWFMLG